MRACEGSSFMYATFHMVFIVCVGGKGYNSKVFCSLCRSCVCAVIHCIPLPGDLYCVTS